MNTDLNEVSRKIRIKILNMIYKSQSSHIGSSLSIVEILVSLYFNILNIDPNNPNKVDRDKFVLSKGYGSAAFYAILAEKGFFPESYLEQYYVNNGKLPGHLDRVAPGIENTAGSLGHGLSIGIGMTLANSQSKNPGRIFVLVGDHKFQKEKLGLLKKPQIDLINRNRN